MKKFRYRLHALLKVKEHIEQERQKQHAAAVHKVQRQHIELTRLDQSREENLSSQRGRMTNGLSVAELLVYSRYLARLRRERLAGSELLKVLKKEAEHKRADLVEAARQRQILEKLKERQAAKHHAEIEHTLTKESDEIAGVHHRRKMQA